MDLDARKLRILETIIDEYVLSAAPVGSRSVSRSAGFNLSSATIRNEMADLEEMGFLEQPHTSAGRIPSDKAYRLYVDRMMNRAQLSEGEIREIRSHFTGKVDAVNSALRQTAKALSSITHYTAMVLAPEIGNDRLKHIQLVPLMPGKALLVVVTETGFAKDAIVHVPEDMDAQALGKLSTMITERLKGTRIDLVPEAINTVLTGELGDKRAFLNGLAETVSRRIAASGHQVELSGAVNMLHYPEYSDPDKARSFLAAVEGKETLYGMLKKASTVEFTITIGSENEHEPLRDCSVVTATYSMGDMPMGSIGVIGPTRMNYAKVVSVLEYMRKSLGEILTTCIEEDR
ncbi:MAG: heat-inducible transcriptional repressor HrcA [Clostridia bacterium]|nr:heat-inducible transcriptional repressor HrcA [Clostridia bacterium]